MRERGQGQGSAPRPSDGGGRRRPGPGAGGGAAPPWATRRARRPRAPTLPEGRPRLPTGVYGDLRAAAKPQQLDDLARAYAAAGEALARDDPARAIELLRWAKAVAGRSAAVREALGVAFYQAGEYAAAQAELSAYRRLSGRADQNHLLADCARALGRGERVAGYVAEMDPRVVGRERHAEGVLVLAGERADRGDVEGALAALESAGLEPGRMEPYQPRLWYLAAELHERQGRPARAREYLEAIAAVSPGFLDVEARLAGLDEQAGQDG